MSKIEVYVIASADNIAYELYVISELLDLLAIEE